MIGVEADRVVYIGCGALESVSRARLSLKILLCYQTELGARFCNFASCGFCAALLEQGLAMHSQVAGNNIELTS